MFLLRLLSLCIPLILLVVEAVGFVGLHACTVKAVGADGFFGQTDTVDEGLYLAELEGRQFEAAGYLGHHALVFGGVGRGISLEIFVGVTLEVFDYLACDELHVALGRGEADEGAAIDERRT